MKYKIFGVWILIAIISLVACQKKKEPEKKESPKKAAAGYVINFKPNDSMDLIPAKTLILQPAPAEGQNNFCVDVVAKGIDQISQIFFDLTFDSASMSFQNFNPGALFEQKGKVVYKIGPKGDQKGRLEAKISFESGGGASGTGKVVTLCFKGLQPSRGDILFENGEIIDLQKKKVAQTNWIGGLLWILETS